ncbi:thiamine-phosphate kinase [Limibacter armeniacum]|uniref:thiamine-phosphate kinase n=1 Tax=Limibacter armeniacum TaxID=466084 RepID=UPI002FE517DB
MAENRQNRTELKDLGEFGLINHLKQQVTLYNPSTRYGIGDDAAVLSESEEETVVSTDLLLEGVHFDLTYTPLKHLGFKAVAVNVSDVAAMNAIPQQITVSIGLSNRFSKEAIDELYAGIYAACEAYKVDLVGGDTTSSRAGLVISVTAIGRAKKEDVVYRNGAQPGDLLCVTGDLGGAYMGLQLLEREKQVFLSNPEAQPELTGFDYVIGRQLKPEARTDMVHEFKESGVRPTSMIDISDGLASEIMHLCTNSEVGAVVYEEKLPIDEETLKAASDFKIPSATIMMNGGEDYELLFTIKQDDFEKLKNNPNVSFIGYIADKESGAKMVSKGGQVIAIEAQGWVHF